MSRRIATAFAALVLVMMYGGIARADDPPRIVLSRVDSGDFPKVRLVASIIDSNGKAVPGLQPQDVQVRERGALAQTSVILASRMSPVALALVVDTSGSMSGRPLADAKAAVATMIAALGPTDQVAVVAFNTTARVAQPLTTDKAAALAAVGSLVAAGDTAIYDALLRSADVLAAADPKSRRAIVLLTDGVDTASQSSPQTAAARIASDGMPLYAIGLGGNLDRPALDALTAAAPGGATFAAPRSAELAGIYAALAEQILTEFSIEYRSGATGLPDLSTVTFEVSLTRGGAALARSSGSFVIPVGHGTPTTSSPTTQPQIAISPAPPPLEVVDNRGQSTWVVGLLGAMTALMFVLWLNELTRFVGAGPRRRLRAIMGDTQAEVTAPGRRPLMARMNGPLRSVGRAVLRFAPGKFVEQAHRRLELAGEPLSEAEFIGLVAVATLGGSLLVLLIAYANWGSVQYAVLGGAMGGATGFALPAMVIGAMARTRKRAIQRALIPSLDMLALSAEAGLAFDGAIAQVIQRWRNPLSEELHRLLLEFQMGRDRRQALRELARRTNVPDVGKFISAVIQADTLGVGLAKVLQDQAIDLRTRRRQRAEELARLAPIKMMFPMVLLIFPALFVVILGPAVPKFITIFNLGH
jgi:tight adherence protein C